MRQRPWVKKFETGEYLRTWNGFETISIGGPYSENMDIGENKFIHCMGFFCGIGDVDWWIAKELEKLSHEEQEELKMICEYKNYIRKVITYELIEKITDLFGCQTFHINRTGDSNMRELCNHLYNFTKKIKKHSKNCLNKKTIQYNEQGNIFHILSFEEFKGNLNEI